MIMITNNCYLPYASYHIILLLFYGLFLLWIMFTVNNTKPNKIIFIHLMISSYEHSIVHSRKLRKALFRGCPGSHIPRFWHSQYSTSKTIKVQSEIDFISHYFLYLFFHVMWSLKAESAGVAFDVPSWIINLPVKSNFWPSI